MSLARRFVPVWITLLLILSLLSPPATAEPASSDPGGVEPTGTAAPSAAATAAQSADTDWPADEELALPSLRDELDDEVFYFVLPDRFHDGRADNNCGDYEGTCTTEEMLEHGFDPTDQGFYHGGDLAGLLDKLDYIEGMGVTAIWMAPVFKNRPVQGVEPDISAGYHGYWTVDYTQIDPHFGTNEELESLIDAAHDRDIKVFFDIITNHTADVITYEEGVFTYVPKADQPYLDVTGEPFDDRDFAGTGTFPELDPAVSFPYTPTFATAEDETIKVPEWLNDPTLYHNRGDSSFSGENSAYGDFFGLDDLFTEHPTVVEGMTDIFTFWTDNYDIDGFRIDTVKHVNREFWEQWVPAVLDDVATDDNPDNDDFFMFGEVFTADPAFLSIFTTNTDMQAVLDFGFQDRATAFAARSAPTNELAAFFASDDWYTDADSNVYSLPTFLGNHDMGRIGTFISQANDGADDSELLARDVLAHALMYAARGMPVIYSGDEQWFTGTGGDKEARQNLDPSQTPIYQDDDQIGSTETPADDNFDTDHPLYLTIADLSALTSNHEALRSGAQLPRYAQDSAGLVAFSRVLREDQVEYLVVANNAETEASATFATGTPDATFNQLWSTDTSGDSQPAPVTSSASGEVSVTMPPLSLTIFQADAALPARDAAPGITLNDLDRFDIEQDSQEQHGLVLSAELDEDTFTEVTFAVSIDGGEWAVAGTDDNAPYAVHYRTDAAPGTSVRVKAVARDGSGNLSSATLEGEVPAPGNPGGGGDCSVDTAVVHYNRPDGAYDDWTLWSFFDITNTMPGDYPNGLPWDGEDDFGVFRTLDLTPDAQQVGVIVVDGNGTKDGTEDDRIFDPRVSPEVWINAGDPTTYTSQAAAQGYVSVHYQRPDGEYGTWPSDDFTDFWGLHLWGDALADGVATEWTAPRAPDGVDEFGAYWQVPIDDADSAFNFIIHRGDEKDPGPDMSVIPADDYGDVWIQSGEEEIHRSAASATDTAVLHYQRPDGDYGTWPSDDFTDFWGVHTWTGSANPTDWPAPVQPTSVDRWGARYDIDLVDGASELAYILHRGDEKDLPEDQFLDLDGVGHEVWIESGEPGYVLPISGCDGPGEGGSLATQSAHWLTSDTIAWDVETDADGTYALHYAADGGLELVEGGIDGDEQVPLEWVSDSLPAGLAEAYPHLAGLDVLRVPGDIDVPTWLRGQLAVSAVADGVRVDATGLQLPGVIDELYATDTRLGVTWESGQPTIAVWAPTAQDVALRRYSVGDADPDSPDEQLPMTRDDATGVWSVTGTPDWAGSYYLFEVDVVTPTTNSLETNLVTDPYALSLSTNSTKSQIVDLAGDAALQPPGWDDVGTTAPDRPEQLNLYELHVRDFSIRDETVPANLRGTYAAFGVENSDGMAHLQSLAASGINAVHLLPTFDIATIEEVRADQAEPDPSPEASLDDWPADSEVQQERVEAVADEDGFNWGYDPYHYTAPEGSYATDPMGTQRIVEYRGMVQSLNDTGLGVVMDVVYNHTAAAGQADQSVLDRIVPGYYHRLLEDGAIATSTCCQNTAPEHAMMGRLVVDSIVTWAREYKVDGFRFDLMGHHPRQNMLDVRAALDALTLEDDGVDGSRIALYGEGWNFGEVANDARFVQATQANMAGTGIATFNDRLRDGVRGGGPFDEDQRSNQGFGSGQWTDPNGVDGNDGSADERDALLLNADRIRVGLAGNLAAYTFIDRTGATVTGAEVDYNGSPTGYTADPQENVLYVSAHDNETLYDSNVFKLPADATMDTRVRMQALGLSTVVYGQGISFFHAGSELLRSKSLDRNSFNSGDHFNEVDWTYQTNRFGIGLPPAPDNSDRWPEMRPLLADPALEADSAAVQASYARVAEHLEVQQSSPLFALESAEQVQQVVQFLNTGADQVPGLIAMHLDDTGGLDIDPERDRLVVLFNGTDEEQTFTVEPLAGRQLDLHPVLAASEDAAVAGASYDATTGTFTVPARTTSVFEESAVISLDAVAVPRRLTEAQGWVVVSAFSGEVDLGEVDRRTVGFGPSEARPWWCWSVDWDRDGDDERATCLFLVAQTGLVAGDTESTLVGALRDGQQIQAVVPVDVRAPRNCPRWWPCHRAGLGGGGGQVVTDTTG